MEHLCTLITFYYIIITCIWKIVLAQLQNCCGVTYSELKSHPKFRDKAGKEWAKQEKNFGKQVCETKSVRRRLFSPHNNVNWSFSSCSVRHWMQAFSLFQPVARPIEVDLDRKGLVDLQSRSRMTFSACLDVWTAEVICGHKATGCTPLSKNSFFIILPKMVVG